MKKIGLILIALIYVFSIEAQTYYSVSWTNNSIMQNENWYYNDAGPAWLTGCNSILPNTNGSVAFQVRSIQYGVYYGVGLWDPGSSNPVNSDGTYSIRYDGTTIYCYAPGAAAQAIPVPDDAVTPLLEVHRVSNKIRYVYNRSLIYEITLASTAASLIPVIFFDQNISSVALQADIYCSTDCQASPVQLGYTVVQPTNETTTDGSVNLTVSGGTPPYTFNWSTSNTSEDLTAVGAGTYTVTVSDAAQRKAFAFVFLTPAQFTTQPIVWIPSAQSGVTHDAPNNQFAAPATGGALVGCNYIAAGASGHMEFELLDNYTAFDFSLGLWSPASGQVTAHQQLTGIKCEAGQGVVCYNQSFANHFFYPSAESPGKKGDKFKIVKNGTTIEYYWNNTLIHTTTLAQDERLHPAIFFGAHSEAIAVKIKTRLTSGCTGTAPMVAYFDRKQPVSGVSNGKIAAYPWGGQAPFTYLWNTGAQTAEINRLQAGTYTVTITDNASQNTVSQVVFQSIAPFDAAWTSIPYLMSFDGTTYVKNYTDASENLIGRNAIPPGEDGFVEFMIMGAFSAVNVNFSFGLTTVTPVIGQPNQLQMGNHQYAFEVLNQTLRTKENSSVHVSLPFLNGAAGTPLRIARQGNKVYFWLGSVLQDSILIPLGNQESFNPYFIVGQLPNSNIRASVKCSEASPAIYADVTKTDIDKDQAGSLSVTLYGGTPPYRYEWSDGSTGNSITGLSPVTYTLTYTDSKGLKGIISTPVYAFADMNWIAASNPNIILSNNNTNFRCTPNVNGEIMLTNDTYIAGTAAMLRMQLLEPVTDINNNFMVGFRDAAASISTPGGFYGFQVIPGVVRVIADGTQLPIVLTHRAGEVLDVIMQDNQFRYYINEALVQTVSVPSGPGAFRTDIKVIGTDLSGLDTKIIRTGPPVIVDPPPTNPPTPSNNQFVALRKHLDNRFVNYTIQNKTIPASATIYYKFYQDYDPASDEVSYKIYDWKKDVVKQGILANVKLGANWQTETFLNPVDGQYYILELKASKGNYYYMRFRTTLPAIIR